MSEQTLLPCPFCGETPTIFPERPEIEGNAWAYVHCVNDSCSAQPTVGDGINVCDDRGSDEYKKTAIVRWNKRAES